MAIMDSTRLKKYTLQKRYVILVISLFFMFPVIIFFVTLDAGTKDMSIGDTLISFLFGVVLCYWSVRQIIKIKKETSDETNKRWENVVKVVKEENESLLQKRDKPITNTIEKDSIIIAMAFSFFLSAMGVVLYQVYNWLRMGEWTGYSLLWLLANIESLQYWVYYPTEWIGFHKLLSGTPLSLLLFVFGIIFLSLLTRAKEYR